MEPIGFLYNNFNTIDNKADGGCLFRFLAITMGLDESLGSDIKRIIQAIKEPKDTTDIDKIGYNNNTLVTFAEIYECKITVFHFDKGISDYYTRQEYYGSSFDFKIYLVVTWENNCWHCKTAVPKNIDFYENY